MGVLQSQENTLQLTEGVLADSYGQGKAGESWGEIRCCQMWLGRQITEEVRVFSLSNHEQMLTGWEILIKSKISHRKLTPRCETAAVTDLRPLTIGSSIGVQSDFWEESVSLKFQHKNAESRAQWAILAGAQRIGVKGVRTVDTQFIRLQRGLCSEPGWKPFMLHSKNLAMFCPCF